LDDALRDLAKRRKDLYLLCAALQGHIDAWQVSTGAAPYSASIAAAGARKDIAVLKEQFASAAQGCLPEDAAALEQMRLEES
jgi:hypothetical protein